MVECKRYQSSLKEEWDQCVCHCKTPLFIFERDYMDYHADRFQDCSLMFYHKGKLIAVLPASMQSVEGDTIVVSHGGLTYGGLLVLPSVKTDVVIQLISLIEREIKEWGGKCFKYKAIPYIFAKNPMQEDLFALFQMGGKVVRRDLSSVIDLKNRVALSKGRKSTIKKAAQSKLLVSPSNNYTEFHQLLCQVLKRHDAEPTHSLDELCFLAEKFPDNITLQVVTLDGKLLAGTVLYVFEQVTHTQYIATTDEGKAVGALDFLLEEQVKYYQSLDKQFFSFGSSMNNTQGDINTGLLSQKEGFGARSIILDQYELLIND